MFMKCKVLGLAALLALTGCGSSGPVVPGNEISKQDFDRDANVKHVLLETNCHVDLVMTLEGSDQPMMYAKSMDMDNSKMKMSYTQVVQPVYFDFDETQTSESSYSFDVYSTIDDASTVYKVTHYKNKSIDNGFMALTQVMQYTSGYSIDYPVGMSYSDFTFVNGVYKSEKAMKFGAYDISDFEISVKDNHFQQIYIAYSTDITGSLIRMTSTFTFSRFGQVSVTLPEVPQ